VFSSNIISSLADKLISGFIALAVLEAQSQQRTVYLQSTNGAAPGATPFSGGG